jgi:splicing factor 3B subunit 5
LAPSFLRQTQLFNQQQEPFIIMSDRHNITSQVEHLQAKYVGTGHADLTKFEWAVNQHRDSYASYIGHYPILSYFAISENEPIARVRYNFLEKMIQPCGPPPTATTTTTSSSSFSVIDK